MNTISNTGRVLRDFAYNTVTLTGTALMNGTVGTVVKLWEVGPIRCAYKVYSLQGFEKLTKATQASLQLLSRLPAIGAIFNEMLKTIEDQRAVVYASSVLEIINQFTFEDKETHTLRLGWEKKGGRLDKAIPILYAMGSFCELGKYLQRYEGLKFETCVEWANKFGNFEIYGWKPATLPVLESLTYSPKNFFIFCSSFLEVIVWLRPACYDLMGKVYDPTDSKMDTWAKQREEITSTMTLLRLTCSIGKMVLTSCGKFHGSQLWFAIANLVTQDASLFSFFIKKIPLK